MIIDRNRVNAQAPRAVLWDVDGTLLDSAEYHFLAWRDILAAERLGVPPAHCIVVEDASAGIEGAHRAGMRAIGVRSTHPQTQADRVVDTLDQLPDDAFDQLLSTVDTNSG